MRPTFALPRISSTIDYESQDAKEESEYQRCWINTMDKGPYKNPSTYQKVEVLLLCWADNVDDMATKHEVNRLKEVFTTKFHFNAHTEYLDTRTGPKLQLQVNAKVAAFVLAHDGLHTLLIVYYAGHGRPGHYYGALEMHNGCVKNACKFNVANCGRQAFRNEGEKNDKKNEKKKQMDHIVWNKTEDLLRPAEADILEIFDW